MCGGLPCEKCRKRLDDRDADNLVDAGRVIGVWRRAPQDDDAEAIQSAQFVERPLPRLFPVKLKRYERLTTIRFRICVTPTRQQIDAADLILIDRAFDLAPDRASPILKVMLDIVLKYGGVVGTGRQRTKGISKTPADRVPP